MRLQVPNYVIKELYWSFFFELLQEMEKVTVNISQIKDGLELLAYENDIRAWLAPVESVMKQLSNRDSRNFTEKDLKIIIISYTVLSSL